MNRSSVSDTEKKIIKYEWAQRWDRKIYRQRGGTAKVTQTQENGVWGWETSRKTEWEPRYTRDFSPAYKVGPQEDKIEILRHVPMVTRCPPCGVVRIGSRSPGALGLFWGTESTAPGRSSPRPRTASPYPTMWSLPSVVFDRSFCIFFFCSCLLIFYIFFCGRVRSAEHDTRGSIGGRTHTQRRTVWESTGNRT